VEGDFRLGEWLVRPRLGAVQSNGRTDRIEPKCMQVLVCLTNQAGEVVSKEELIRTVWADAFVSDEVLTRAISELRRVFSDDAKQPRLIETIPKIGYRVIAPVRPVAADPTPDQDRKTSRRFSWQVAGAIFLLLASAAVILALVGRFSPTPGKAGATRIQSIAVLPLEDLSRDPEQEYFANGMTDELINKLAQIRVLRVASRSSVMRFRGTQKTPDELAKLLNVDAVVEGTVQRSGNRLRINAALVDSRSGKQLWAQSYDRDLSDVLTVQNELAQAIVKGIEVSTTPEENQHLAQKETVSPEAYDQYLRGIFYWNLFSEKGMRKAVDYFQQAIAKDPNYAHAYAGLAQSYHELAIYEPVGEAMPKAKAAANRALELDANLADAHAALGWILWCYDWDFKNAEREFLKAIELEPNNAMPHAQYSYYLDSAGRPDDAMREINRARELEPFSAIISTSVGQMFEGQHRYGEAERVYLTTIEMHPDFSQAYANLGEVYVLQHRFPEGIRVIRKAMDLDTDSQYPATLIWAYAESGDKVTAHRIFDQLLASAKTRYVYPSTLARAYAFVGDRENSQRWIRRACEERDPSMLWWVNQLMSYPHMKDDPRCTELVKTIGVPF
jgi:TolB-like protein/DNA-binding winged helix-turn-helix (wHTH) protein/Flp pilus assembly protein TadD